MAERQGFMIYHEDANMLLSADDTVIGLFFRKLAEFSMTFDETGEVPIEVPFDGMTRGLYLSMRNKVIRDKNRYDETVRENTIKGLISAIKRDYKSRRMSISDENARQLATDKYQAMVNSGQPQLTPADSSELTVAERSVAEAATETVPVTKNETVAVAGAKAEAVNLSLLDVRRVAEEKGVIPNVNNIIALNAEVGKTSPQEVIERINSDSAFVEYLRSIT